MTDRRLIRPHARFLTLVALTFTTVHCASIDVPEDGDGDTSRGVGGTTTVGTGGKTGAGGNTSLIGSGGAATGGGSSAGGSLGTGGARDTSNDECATDADCQGTAGCNVCNLVSDVLVCEADTSLTECTDACVDVMTDPDNCGDCDSPCLTGQSCGGGSCSCDVGEVCDGACVDTDSDEAHCGACDAPCGGGTPFCVSGTCAAEDFPCSIGNSTEVTRGGAPIVPVGGCIYLEADGGTLYMANYQGQTLTVSVKTSDGDITTGNMVGGGNKPFGTIPAGDTFFYVAAISSGAPAQFQVDNYN